LNRSKRKKRGEGGRSVRLEVGKKLPPFDPPLTLKQVQGGKRGKKMLEGESGNKGEGAFGEKEEGGKANAKELADRRRTRKKKEKKKKLFQ